MRTPLTAAIVGDHALQAECGGCILSAAWLDASYPRVTVDLAGWQRLSKAQRTALAARALRDAAAVYVEEWAAADIYQRVFIVDRRGSPLISYQP